MFGLNSQSILVKDKIQNLTVLYIKYGNTYILGIKIRKSKMDLNMVALTIGCIVISYIPTDHNAVIKFISLTGYCTICPAAVMQSVPQHNSQVYCAMINQWN